MAADMVRRETPWQVAVVWFRVLTFRARHEELAGLGTRHLAFGLLATAFVGLGRYWDNPEANIAQLLGVGSVAYIVVLAAILWIVVKPLGPSCAFTYRNILTWLSLCSLPAALYAIPVERLVSLHAARSLNITFLIIVASWRVALLVCYLRRVALLSTLRVVVATLLPLTAIVATLAVLNLEHAAFSFMGGFEEPDSRTAVYIVILVMAVTSMYLFPVLAIAWLIFAFKENKNRRLSRIHARRNGSSTTIPP